LITVSYVLILLTRCRRLSSLDFVSLALLVSSVNDVLVGNSWLAPPSTFLFDKETGGFAPH
ncbi:hypothetical protein PM022_19480, partial [Halorubrum ezzemoulense]|uniref:hypothetical protein n=1 Tax=Halorubrum ezzemoulense TaxID=337243 RepID=UPI00232CF970